MLDEHSPTNVRFLLLFWSVGDGTPGPLHRHSKCSLHCTCPQPLTGRQQLPTELYPQPALCQVNVTLKLLRLLLKVPTGAVSGLLLPRVMDYLPDSSEATPKV